MDSAITALIGAAIGASSAIISSWITLLLQRRNEHRKWLRDKKQEAYSNVLRYLLRTKYKRSKIYAGGFRTTPTTESKSTDVGDRFWTTLSTEYTKEWFDDIILLIDSLASLSIISPGEYKKGISKQASEVKRQIESIFYSEGKNEVDVSAFSRSLDDLEKAIEDTEASDMSEYADSGSIKKT